MSYLRYLSLFTYCVVFLLCFSLSCVPYVVNFSGLFIFDCPFGIPQCLFKSLFIIQKFWSKNSIFVECKKYYLLFLIFCKSCLSLLGNLM